MKVAAVIILMGLAVASYGGDIVTVPTANQLKAGQVDVANYYLGLDTPDPQPSSLMAQTVYIGLTDKLELDVHRYDPEASKDKSSTIINGSFLLVPESKTMPNVVFGGRNLTGVETTLAPVDSSKTSWFVCAAKNVTPMLANGPQLPLVRLHLGVGTADWTLLGEKRHQGLFGGVQALLKPEVGTVALFDGQDLITGLTYSPKKVNGLTVKGGTFGKHWWSGISYAKTLK